MTTNDDKISMACESLTFSALDGDAPKRFTGVAYTGGLLKLAGKPVPYVVDLAGLVLASNRPVLKDHSPAMIVGHADRAELRDGGLYVEGVVSGAGAVAGEVVQAARNGFPWQLSVGVEPIAPPQFIAKGKSIQANGRTFNGPLVYVAKSELQEISFTALGADASTSARIAASKWKESNVDHDQNENAGQGTDELAQEELLIAEIETICAGRHPEIQASAIKEGWDLTKAKIAVLRASRPNVSVVRRDGNTNSAAAMSAALCFSAGLPGSFIAKQYGEHATDQATSKDFRETSIHSLMFDVIQAAGLHVRPGRVTDDVIRTAYRAENMLQASGFSTLSLTGVLGDAMHKSLLSAYEAQPSVATRIARERDVNDFRKHSSYRVTGMGMLEPLGERGEIEHMTLTEAEYENQAKMFARMIVLSYENQINDDLGAFFQIPQILGRQAALRRESLVFDLLKDNADNFFSVANGNYLSGATSALGITGLTNAEQVFDEQEDDDGKPILLQPKSLLVPSALKVTAQSLMKETRVVGATDRLADNPHAGKWEPLASPFLKSAPKAWYLFADPAQVAAIELAYLRGKRTPTIEQGEVSFSQLGIAWRCTWALGAAKQDPRGAVMAAGE
jgi:hypothetical protein